jgi:hypothetical protein
MATLTITTTGGTTNTYPGLTVAEAEEQRDKLTYARSQFNNFWSIQSGTKTDVFATAQVTTISVDSANV